nr:hypothetical protein [Tanacetum cinerariifolium]
LIDKVPEIQVQHQILPLLLLVDVCARLVPYRKILGDMIT